jgi:hypothetical protein
MQSERVREAPQGALAGQQAGAPVPATPQAPPGMTVNGPGCTVDPQAAAQSPTLTYRAAVSARNELQGQLSTVEEKRTSIAQRLRGQGGDAAPGADLKGLEARITDLDGQITSLYAQIRCADAVVASAAAVPGATLRPDEIPEEAVVLGSLFMIFVLFPLSIAFARRMWKRTNAAVAALPKELMERLTRIEDSVESVAIEVERVGESQRFVTNLLIDNGPHALGAGEAQPVEVRQPEAVEEHRHY